LPDYTFTTALTTKVIADTFRRNITRGDSFVTRGWAKQQNWQFYTPDRKAGDPFTVPGEAVDWTFAVGAHIGWKSSMTRPGFIEAMSVSDILLAVWEAGSGNRVSLRVPDVRGPIGCARNFLNAVRKLDPKVQVSEQTS
jgi:hypothetical protein